MPPLHVSLCHHLIPVFSLQCLHNVSSFTVPPFLVLPGTAIHNFHTPFSDFVLNYGIWFSCVISLRIALFSCLATLKDPIFTQSYSHILSHYSVFFSCPVSLSYLLVTVPYFNIPSQQNTLFSRFLLIIIPCFHAPSHHNSLFSCPISLCTTIKSKLTTISCFLVSSFDIMPSSLVLSCYKALFACFPSIYFPFHVSLQW